MDPKIESREVKAEGLVPSTAAPMAFPGLECFQCGALVSGMPDDTFWHLVIDSKTGRGEEEPFSLGGGC